MTHDRDPVPLIGRSGELGQLRSALAGISHGGTAAVFLSGESGVGKTYLLAAGAAQLRADGATVLTGGCLDIGDAAPLHPLRQAVESFTPTGGREGSPAAAAARSVISLLDSDAAEDAGGLLQRVSKLLGEVSGGRPLVLMVDDLHAADSTTRQLLLYLLAGLGGLRLLLIGAARTEALHGEHPVRRMLLELRRLRSVRMLQLEPLDRIDAGRLTMVVAGSPLEPAVEDLVFEQSRGNPFLISELARAANDGTGRLPDAVREILLGKVQALPPHCRRVANAMAAGVDPVEHQLLASVVRLDEDELVEAIRTMVDQRILSIDGDGYRFHHRLLKELLEAALLPAERMPLHRRYATKLSAGPVEGHRHAQVAHHWRLAGDQQQALTAAVAAAEAAERLLGFAEAHELWSIAFTLSDRAADKVPDRIALGRRAVDAARSSGDHDGALVLLDELARLHGPHHPEWLFAARAGCLASAGRCQEALEQYLRALETTDDETVAERAMTTAHCAELLLQMGRYAEAGQRARDALARAGQDCASATVVAGAVLGFSQAYLADTHADAGLRTLREALLVAERAGSPDDVGCAYLYLAELLTGPLNELEAGVELARVGARRAEELGVGRRFGTRLLAVAANGLFRIGRWTEATEAVDIGLRHRPAGAEAVELLLARSRVFVARGDLDAAERDLDAVATLLADGGARHVLPMLTLRAGLATWQRRFGDARDAIRRGLSTVETIDEVWLLAPLTWHGLRVEAEAFANGGEPPDDAMVTRLVAINDRGAVPTGDGGVQDAVAGYRELGLGELSRLAERPDPSSWARAATIWQARHQPYPVAYALLRQAEALFGQRTRNAEAVAVLHRANGIAHELGARPLLDEIQLLASRARVKLVGNEPAPTGVGREPVRVPHKDPLAGLTVRELEVLTHVADGLTNEEIGRRLFISNRTVGVHVSRILAKLQVRSRVQAGAVFLRRRRAAEPEEPV
jgi:DNA-binding CsgD family transcriptional regulator